MRHHLWLAIVATALAAVASAQSPATLDEARQRAAKTGRPVLLEFYRDD